MKRRPKQKHLRPKYLKQIYSKLTKPNETEGYFSGLDEGFYEHTLASGDGTPRMVFYTFALKTAQFNARIQPPLGLRVINKKKEKIERGGCRRRFDPTTAG